MNGLFALDGPVNRVMSKITDLAVLSLLWFLCSLPLVTAGAATTALYTMTLRMVRKEEGKLAAGYLRAFRDNLKEATAIHLLLTAALLLLGVYWQLLGLLSESLRFFFRVFSVFLLFQILLELLFVYPVQARFQNTIWNIMKNAWIMAAGNLPVCLVVLVLTGLPLGVFLTNTVWFLRLLPFWVVIAPGLTAWLNSFLFHHCFRRYIAEEEDG